MRSSNPEQFTTLCVDQFDQLRIPILDDALESLAAHQSSVDTQSNIELFRATG